jgi:hypothetical protein
MTWRSALYTFLRVSNDVRAIQRGRIGERLWNRLVGRLAGRLFR